MPDGLRAPIGRKNQYASIFANIVIKMTGKQLKNTADLRDRSDQYHNSTPCKRRHLMGPSSQSLFNFSAIEMAENQQTCYLDRNYCCWKSRLSWPFHDELA
jgi:hypothetical protein